MILQRDSSIVCFRHQKKEIIGLLCRCGAKIIEAGEKMFVLCSQVVFLSTWLNSERVFGIENVSYYSGFFLFYILYGQD